MNRFRHPFQISLLGFLLLSMMISCAAEPEEDALSSTSDEDFSEVKFSDSCRVNYLNAIGYDKGTIALVVEKSLTSSLFFHLRRLANDLKNEGYSTVLNQRSKGNTDQSDNSDDQELKTCLQNIDELVGVIMIGDLPIAYFDTKETKSATESHIKYPSDTYFSDLERSWADETAIDGYFDYIRSFDTDGALVLNKSTDPDAGTNRPDENKISIWVSRIDFSKHSISSSFFASESARLEAYKSYFDRNHKFRTGQLESSGTALDFQDDDWSSSTSRLQSAYPDQVTLISSKSDTSKEKYFDAITSSSDSYEWVRVFVHSSSTYHQFYQPENSAGEIAKSHLLNSDLFEAGDNLTPYFYSLFACSTGDMAADNYFAASYLANGNTLFVQAPTRPIGVGSNGFFTNVGAGLTFGDSFVQDFNEVESHFGTGLFGDASLKISRYVAEFQCTGDDTMSCKTANGLGNGRKFRSCKNGLWTSYSKCIAESCESSAKLRMGGCYRK